MVAVFFFPENSALLDLHAERLHRCSEQANASVFFRLTRPLQENGVQKARDQRSMRTTSLLSIPTYWVQPTPMQTGLVPGRTDPVCSGRGRDLAQVRVPTISPGPVSTQTHTHTHTQNITTEKKRAIKRSEFRKISKNQKPRPAQKDSKDKCTWTV